MLYGASADVTLSMYSQHCTGVIFQHPSKEDPPHKDHVAQFMDGATQLLNIDGIEAHFAPSMLDFLQMEAESQQMEALSHQLQIETQRNVSGTSCILFGMAIVIN